MTRHDPHLPSDSRDTPAPATARSDRLVHEASEESFPASDAPQFTQARAGKPDRVANNEDVGDHEHHDARAWAESFLTALDHDDIDALLRSFTEDAVVRLGGGQLLVGHRAISSAITRWIEQIGATRHKVIDVRVDGDALFIESEVTYQTSDGAAGMWSEMISARLRLGSASRMMIYGAPMVSL